MNKSKKEKKLHINDNFDQIVNEKMVVMITENVDTIFLLNENETIILNIFSTQTDINEAYMSFCDNHSEVIITKEDFYDFIQQLIDKRLLLTDND